MCCPLLEMPISSFKTNAAILAQRLLVAVEIRFTAGKRRFIFRL
jgi:hypothetical protein